MAAFTDLKDRPVKETVCLFDVDGTLTPARQAVSPEMLQTLLNLRQKCAIGFVCLHPAPLPCFCKLPEFTTSLVVGCFDQVLPATQPKY